MAVPYDGGTKVCPDDWLTFYLEKNNLTEEQEELVYNNRV